MIYGLVVNGEALIQPRKKKLNFLRLIYHSSYLNEIAFAFNLVNAIYIERWIQSKSADNSGFN